MGRWCDRDPGRPAVGGPAGAPDNQEAASAVYVVAFQIGIGLGSFLGDRFVAADQLDTLPVFSALVALTAGVVVLAARRAFPR